MTKNINDNTIETRKKNKHQQSLVWSSSWTRYLKSLQEEGQYKISRNILYCLIFTKHAENKFIILFSSENKVGIFSYNVFWSWFKPDQIAFERHEANILRVHHMHFTDVSIDNAMYQRDSWTTYVLNRTLFYQRTVLTQQQMWLMEWFSPCSVKSG